MHNVLRTLRTAFLSAFILVAASATLNASSLVVGGKNFTEQYILAECAQILLEDAGISAKTKTGVGSALARKSLVNAQFDLYFEYTGTAYTVYYEQDDKEIMTDPQKVYDWVKKRDQEKGLVWLDPIKFNNTYTLMMRKEQAQELDIQTIEDFGAYVDENPDAFIFATDAEFWERPDGFKGLMRTYDFRMPANQIEKMSLGLTYKSLRDDQVDVAMGFSTDGRIAAFGFVTLDDNRNFFPVYNPVPVVREEVLEEYPEIPEILQPLAENLDTEQMQKLNKAVDVEHKDAKKVATQWLKDNGLI
ncbi:MAG: glycine betaine ABC transporter substrate-binding protein [Thermodesulfobacteriota bacterium]